MTILLWLAIVGSYTAGVFAIGGGINLWRFNKFEAVELFILAIAIFGMSIALSINGFFRQPEHVPIAPIQGPPAPPAEVQP